MRDKFIFEEGDFYWGDVRSSEHYADDPLVYDDMYILKQTKISASKCLTSMSYISR